MKRTSLLILILVLSSIPAYAGLADMMKGFGGAQKGGPDESTTASGLKEALTISAENAVKNVSRVDGYFGDQAIKILMPEKIRKVGDVLGKIGYQKQVDDFVLSMNRAAEKAAPMAVSFFVEAIKEMTFEDARKILGGGDT